MEEEKAYKARTVQFSRLSKRGRMLRAKAESEGQQAGGSSSFEKAPGQGTNKLERKLHNFRTEKESKDQEEERPRQKLQAL